MDRWTRRHAAGSHIISSWLDAVPRKRTSTRRPKSNLFTWLSSNLNHTLAYVRGCIHIFGTGTRCRRRTYLQKAQIEIPKVEKNCSLEGDGRPRQPIKEAAYSSDGKQQALGKPGIQPEVLGVGKSIEVQESAYQCQASGASKDFDQHVYDQKSQRDTTDLQIPTEPSKHFKPCRVMLWREPWFNIYCLASYFRTRNRAQPRGRE